MKIFAASIYGQRQTQSFLGVSVETTHFPVISDKYATKSDFEDFCWNIALMKMPQDQGWEGHSISVVEKGVLMK